MKKIVFSFLIIAIAFTAYSKGGGRRGSLADAEGAGHDVGITVGPAWSLTDLGGAKKIGSPFLRDIEKPSISSQNFKYVEAYAQKYLSDGGTTKIVVAAHPQGKKESDWVKEVFDAFKL